MVKEELGNVETIVEKLRNELGTKVDSLQGELTEVKHYTLVLANHTESHLEDKEELASLQRDMNSTLHILQEIKNQLVSLREENSTTHENLHALSCSELHTNNPSDYYWLRGSSDKVYCDMDRQS